MKLIGQKGFTLLELMTAITILAILLAIAVPSFSDIVRNSRISSQTNAIVSALNLARSEATKRGIPVATCAGNPALSNCLGAADWSKGWIDFGDTPGTAPGTIDGVDFSPGPPARLFQTWPAPSSGVTVTTTAVFVSFAPDGSLMSPAITFTVSHPDCTGTHGRQITIDTTGRISSVAVACP
jgi:type IV fimbrial biogenesis protein FimT